MSIWHWSPWSPDNVNFIPLPCTMMWNVFGMLVKVPFSCIIIGTNCLISIDCTIRIDSVCRSVVPLMSNIGKVRKWKNLVHWCHPTWHCQSCDGFLSALYLPFFIQSRPPFYSVRPFLHPGWSFLCWMGLFFKQKGPLPPMLGQATMSLNYKQFGQSWPPFQNQGAPWDPVNFCFIDVILWSALKCTLNTR